MMPELTVKNAFDSDDASNIDKKATDLQTTELTCKNSMVGPQIIVKLIKGDFENYSCDFSRFTLQLPSIL
jgi:hypothetical protein